MSRRTGIILAYDKSTFTAIDRELLQKLTPHIDMVKVGLEAMTARSGNGNGADTIANDVCNFAEGRFGIMWDMKLNDIPNTMAGATKNIVVTPAVKMFTIHASAGSDAMKAVVEACGKTNALPLAVTVLTSIDEECFSIFGNYPSNKVLGFATDASHSGIKGLVCSPQELRLLADRGMINKFTTVIPGIRPAASQLGDQKRTMTPAEAARAGADYIVVGRPIMHAPDPALAAAAIRKELDEALVST